MMQPKRAQGFECLDMSTMALVENENSTSGYAFDATEAAMIQVTILQASQQVVQGKIFNIAFSFTTTDPRCPNAAGAFQASVLLDETGLFSVLTIAPSNFEPGSDSSVNKGAVIGGSITAFIVVAAVVGGLVWRWRRTHAQYQSLKEVHSEMQRRVAVLEQDAAVGDIVRNARLSELTGQDKWVPYKGEAARRGAPSRAVPPPPKNGSIQLSSTGSLRRNPAADTSDNTV